MSAQSSDQFDGHFGSKTLWLIDMWCDVVRSKKEIVSVLNYKLFFDRFFSLYQTMHVSDDLHLYIMFNIFFNALNSEFNP